MLANFRPRRPSRVTVGRTPIFKGTGAAGLLFAFLSVVPAAEARTSCSYAGPPANTLTVRVMGFSSAEIARFGEQILVSEFLERPRHCSGGDPTVMNTDTIQVLTRGFGDADLRLGGGPFAPGATPEDEGVSEIEVQVRGDGFASVVGTRRADEFHWGKEGALAGLNVNPRDIGDQDVDVTVRGESAFLVADGAGGNDSIIPAPGAPGPRVFSEGGGGADLLIAPRNSGGILEGGAGVDVLTGGVTFDLVAGGAGNDRVAAGGGRDEIDGGRGRDLISGGRGRDRISARDSTRDVVRCGPGRDRVKADRGDRLRGCELVSRR
jgi:hypothetical protein